MGTTRRGSSEQALLRLARHEGVQTKYRDALSATHFASPDALIAILSAMGHPLQTTGDAADCLWAAQEAVANNMLPPVTVVFATHPPAPARVSVRVRLGVPSAASGDGAWTVVWTMEDGRIVHPPLKRSMLGEQRTGDLVREIWQLTVSLPDLPLGYHRLQVTVAGQHGETWVVAHPRQAYRDATGPHLGVFCPIYALVGDADDGMGSYQDLERWQAWAAQVPAFVATLPLLPTWLKGAVADASPYSPITRLFWHDVYATKALPGATRPARWVDWSAVGAARASQLEREWERARARGPAHPWSEHADDEARRYARFRAYYEAHPEPWWQWPEPARSASLPDDPGLASREDFYLYALWRADQAMARIARSSAEGMGPLLDLPLGVHPAGYDVWRYRSLFAREITVGAPPDALNAHGQNWGFPPLIPSALRQSHYRYWIRALVHQLGRAQVVRIDHVMGLHRQLWIPPGGTARDGTYVHYPARELYAILALESVRAATAVVGEDLGNVPAVVRRTMAARGVSRLVVVRPGRPRPTPPPAGLVTTGTHDMATWATAFASLSEHDAREWRTWLGLPTDASPAAVYRASVERLAESTEQWLLLNLEDLWLEVEPQNRPGTPSRDNWRQRARRPLVELERDAELLAWLQDVARRLAAKPAGAEHAAPPAHPDRRRVEGNYNREDDES